jgi:hypothetical protein
MIRSETSVAKLCSPKWNLGSSLRSSGTEARISDLVQRRGFLRGLTALPLVGGGVTLIGNPTKADVPTSDELLDA